MTDPDTPLLNDGSSGTGYVETSAENRNMNRIHSREFTYSMTTLLRVELAEYVIQGATVSKEHQIIPPAVSTSFLICELRISGCHSRKQSIRINERQEGNALPCQLFAIHVDAECLGIEVKDRRVSIDHQFLKWHGQVHTTAKSSARITEMKGPISD